VTARKTPNGAVLVSADNFTRAESDLYFSNVVNDGEFGKFTHIRELTSLDKQLVVRSNRDTLYSAGVFDLEAGYVMVAIRTLVDPNDDADFNEVHALQDAIAVQQDHAGSFEIPKWDPVSQKKVRDALLQLSATLPDSKGMFGKNDTDPVRRLIGSASAWGGNPEKDAMYFSVHPAKNDGATVHRLCVDEVPVDGFWSVTVYNKDGYFTPNPQNAYSLNNITAQRGTGGKIIIQFGGCDATTANCLPITPGWNYLVRLYRPQDKILSGEWTFPEAEPIS
jgi:hypothetical protein